MARLRTPVMMESLARPRQPTTKKENAADKVDEELELRDPAANDVVEEDAGDDDGIADNNSHAKEITITHPAPSPVITNWASPVVLVKSDNHQNHQDQDKFNNLEEAVDCLEHIGVDTYVHHCEGYHKIRKSLVEVNQ